jgi:hypothetical protein
LIEPDDLEVGDVELDELDQQEVRQRVQKLQNDQCFGYLKLKFDDGRLVQIVECYNRRP